MDQHSGEQMKRIWRDQHWDLAGKATPCDANIPYGLQVQVPAAPVLIQLPANVPEKALEDEPVFWPLPPVWKIWTSPGLHKDLAYWFQPDPIQSLQPFGEMNQQMVDLNLFFSKQIFLQKENVEHACSPFRQRFQHSWRKQHENHKACTVAIPQRTPSCSPIGSFNDVALLLIYVSHPWDAQHVR